MEINLFLLYPYTNFHLKIQPYLTMEYFRASLKSSILFYFQAIQMLQQVEFLFDSAR